MRISLLFNGYFRHYKHLYKNFIEYLYIPLSKHGQIDIFFSTWSGLNNSNSFSVKHGAQGECVEYGEFDLNDINKKYNPIRGLVGDYNDSEFKFNIRRYDKDLDISTLHKDIHNNGTLFCLNQYFHRWVANDLKKQYEKDNNFKYDVVISMRPDLIFLKPFDLAQCDLSKLNIRTLYNDAFLVTDSITNDKIDSLFPNIQNIVNKYKRNKVEWFENYCPEWWLENHLLDIDIPKDKRKELGEDVFWYYPRKHFVATCHEIYNKTGQLEKFQYIVDYFKLNG